MHPAPAALIVLLFVAGCSREGARPYYPVDGECGGECQDTGDTFLHPLQDGSADVDSIQGMGEVLRPADGGAQDDGWEHDGPMDVGAQDRLGGADVDSLQGMGEVLRPADGGAQNDGCLAGTADCEGDCCQGVGDELGSAECGGECQETGDGQVSGVFEVGAGPGTEEPFAPTEENSYGVELDKDGNLVASAPKSSWKDRLWVPASTEATVSLYDLVKGSEITRRTSCGGFGRGAVDADGSIWHACGDTVFKHAVEGPLCKDKNGNAAIETAKDKNGDGKIDAGEMPAGMDECSPFAFAVTNYEVSGLALDSESDAWLVRTPEGGGIGEAVVEKRSGMNGGPEGPAIAIEGPLFGAALDSVGHLWTARKSDPGAVVRIDIAGNQWQEHTFDFTSLDDGVDVVLDYKERVLIAQASGDVIIFSPDTQTAAVWSTSANVGAAAAAFDGLVFASHPDEDEVAAGEIDYAIVLPEGFDPIGINMPAGCQPVGVGLVVDGNGFAFCEGTKSVRFFDPETFATYPGLLLDDAPDGIGDFSGYLSGPQVHPGGTYETAFECPAGPGSSWTSVALSLDTQGSDECFATVRMRAADDADDLPYAGWLGPAGPLSAPDLSVALDKYPNLDHPFLQVRVKLFKGGANCNPVLKGVSAACGATSGGE